MTPADIRQGRASLFRSPTGLANLFCGATAVGWLLLLALTFTDRSLVILAASVAWGLLAGLTLLLMISLSRRRMTWGRVVIVLACWVLATLLISNAAADYWQSRQRLWSGFVFNTRYGWYPEAHLDRRKLTIPNGTYVASTDELGHRNPLPYPADDVLPVILQGDSNAFGFGLAEEETLSAMLNETRPQRPVYNVGVPGFDLNHYYYQYAELEQRFRIEHRIVLWNIGNDFTLSALETPNYFRRPYLYVDQQRVRFASDFQSPYPVQGYGQSFIPPYREYDHLIQTLAYDWADQYPEMLVRIPLSRQLIRTYHPKICRVGEALSRPSEPVELLAPGWMLLKRARWPVPFSSYAEDLPLLLRELKRQNPRLTICLFPMREQVIPAEYQTKKAAVQALGYSESDFEPLAFNRYFQSVCDAEAISLVDPTPQFMQDPEPISLYQENDQHLSAKGIQLCAQALLATETAKGNHNAN